MDKYLIAGLGNIGDEYRQTRHNAGFDVIDALALKHDAVFKTARLAEVAEMKLRGRNILLIKPNTYMNLSGKAIRYWLDQEKIPLTHMLVVLDDIAIPLSKIRLRPSGSDGGHNGLKNIQEILGTTHYPRLRFGIGGDYPKGKQVDFVLGRWNEQEIPIVKKKFQKCAEVIESYVFRGLEATMNEANKLEFTS